MAARHEEGCYEKNILKNVLVCEGLSNDDVGVARGIVFQEIRPEAGFKTGDFVKEKGVGGATTVERLRVSTVVRQSSCALRPGDGSLAALVQPTVRERHKLSLFAARVAKLWPKFHPRVTPRQRKG